MFPICYLSLDHKETNPVVVGWRKSLWTAAGVIESHDKDEDYENWKSSHCQVFFIRAIICTLFSELAKCGWFIHAEGILHALLQKKIKNCLNNSPNDLKDCYRVLTWGGLKNEIQSHWGSQVFISLQEESCSDIKYIMFK